MALTVYKSTDASAPQMNVSAGTLLAVLDACLVNGYGSKAAAGWSKTVVDAATHQALYTQGAAAGLAQKKFYVKDDASSPGGAIAWACDTCTLSATPAFTNNFWTQTVYSGVVTKADQNNGGCAKWILIATSRWFYLFCRRSNWGDRGGWQAVFAGDLDSPYPNDKGKFAVTGQDSYVGNIAIGGANRAFNTLFIGVYGNQDGTPNVSYYSMKRFMGDTAPYADTSTPKSAYGSGVVMSKLVAVDTKRYRGTLPCAYRTVASLDALSWYMFEDEAVIPSADATRTFLHLRFGGTITGAAEPGRLFFDITGAL